MSAETERHTSENDSTLTRHAKDLLFRAIVFLKKSMIVTLILFGLALWGVGIGLEQLGPPNEPLSNYYILSGMFGIWGATMIGIAIGGFVLLFIWRNVEIEL